MCVHTYDSARVCMYTQTKIHVHQTTTARQFPTQATTPFVTTNFSKICFNHIIGT